MLEEATIQRTKRSGDRQELLEVALTHPNLVIRELNNRSFYHFLEHFWPVVSAHKFQHNWHIEYLCQELEKVAYQVAEKKPREYDLIINVPPGSTKTITCSIMFPAWCWTKWYWMRFICGSYSGALSLESAEYSRDLIASMEFEQIYPDLSIKEDKNTKSNFKVVRKQVTSPGKMPRLFPGGNRYSTSVGGTLTGFHGDILIIDDPINPSQAVSDIELGNANRWMEQTLSTRKTDKAVTPTILIMQRLHQDDPSGHMLAKQKENVKHICIPGEARTFRKLVKPPELYDHYIDDLMDPKRMPWSVLDDLLADLGQYGYAGQVGQDPTPPGGGMFKVAMFNVVDRIPTATPVVSTVRYWDKAGTEDQGKKTTKAKFTAGVKMSRLSDGRWLIHDVKRGKWGTDERERVIKATTMADGTETEVWIEQEPGSGGKESAESTIKNLAGFVIKAERPQGDKVYRADPYSVQVNNGNVMLLRGDWTHSFIEEHRFFPFGTFKDQVDAAGAAFSKLVAKKIARRIT